MIISIVVADLIILLLWEYLDPMEVKINSFAKEVRIKQYSIETIASAK